MIDDHFGIDNLRVLFVTTNEKRMRNMIAASPRLRAKAAAQCLDSPAVPISEGSQARPLRTDGSTRSPGCEPGTTTCGSIWRTSDN
jgi:hypothetical protein